MALEDPPVCLHLRGVRCCCLVVWCVCFVLLTESPHESPSSVDSAFRSTVGLAGGALSAWPGYAAGVGVGVVLLLLVGS